KVQDEDLAAFLRTLDQLRDHVERTKTYRPIEIHAYRPSPEVIEGFAGFLNFERPYVRKLIDAGYEDAVQRAPPPATSATTPLESSFLGSRPQDVMVTNQTRLTFDVIQPL